MHIAKLLNSGENKTAYDIIASMAAEENLFILSEYKGAQSKLSEQRDELLEALEDLIAITKESRGIAGYHLNGEIAEWGEFEFYDKALKAIAKAKG